jgi:hypothetical protein
LAGTNLVKVINAFLDLNEKEQAALIGNVYKFSKDMKTFLEHRLLNVESKYYFVELEKITYERFGAIPPKWVDARKVNAVISKAKKANVGDHELFKLHFYVFEAYVAWIDMYGMSDEAVENKCAMHLVKALELLYKLPWMNDNTKEKYLHKANDIVDKHDNMYRDHLYDILADFETGADPFRPN